jgi:hypothetical protein
MSIIKRAADLAYTFRFLTLLVTPFEKTKAFDLGIIDAQGNRVKSVEVSTGEQKSAYTAFHRLVFNIKRLLAKVPGGSSSLASYAAALYLIKEKLELKDSDLQKIVEKSGYEPLDFLKESSEWFVLNDKRLSPGIYKMKYSKVVNSTCEEIVRPKDQIRISENCYPVGEIFGLDIYEAVHMMSQQKIYIAVEEIVK